MKYLITFLFLLFCTYANSQNPIEAPSPISLNHNEFVNSAYNANNGTSNISIPIASINEGTISHAITLYTNTDAPKAHEQAGIVGLGWHLSAGGMVTRQVRGIPDEDDNGFYNNPGVPIDIEDAADEDADSAPDLFFFNAGTLSGSFTIDDAGEFVTIPKSTIKIETDETNPLSTFLITDDMGTKYFFAFDPLVNLIETVGYEGRRNGWFLNKIESLDGQLEFEYEEILSENRYISEQYALSYVDVANNNNFEGSGLIKTGNIPETNNVLSEDPLFSFTIKKNYIYQ